MPKDTYRHDVKAAAALISADVDMGVAAAGVVKVMDGREEAVLRLSLGIRASMDPDRVARNLAEALLRLHDHQESQT